ncbi:MAG: cytochrome C [Nitrospirae bacterium]|nr:cytochrome C [Nitrospirota bacterium]MBI5694846.1 cytochrome C [Nitrospirota bacterium]
MKRLTCVLSCLAVLALSLPAYAEDAPSAELGKKLFNDPALGTNGKSCATCHPSEKKVGELATRGTWFGGRAKTLVQANNICITGPLAGKALPEDSVEARSLAMYMNSLAK